MKKIFIVLFMMLFILVSCQKEEMGYDHRLFPSGLIAIEKDDQWGYMNEEADVVIDFQYDRASAFLHDTAIVKIGDYYQLIDTKGNELLDEAQPLLFRDPYTDMIYYSKDNKVGLYDRDGHQLTDPMFDKMSLFSEGFAWFQMNDLFGLINDQGKIIVDAIYEDVEPFENGYAPVKKDGFWGAIDTKGRVVLDFEYELLRSANDKNHMVSIKIQDDQSVLIDLIDIEKQKVIISNASFLNARSPQYLVKEDDEPDFYVFNPKNEEKKTLSYDIISGINPYTLGINIDDVLYYALLDENYEIVHQSEREYSRFILSDDDQDFVIVESKDDQVKIYSLDHKDSIDIDADAVIQFSDDVIVAMKNGAYGVYDNQGEVKIDFDYIMIQYFSDGYFLCQDDGRMVIYTSEYEEISLQGIDRVNVMFNITSWNHLIQYLGSYKTID